MSDSLQLERLNPRQYEAVTAPEKSILVLAGAGSGKTRVLTTRIAWLLEKGLADPRSILAVTFTNKAAKEMLTRLEAQLPMDFRRMWIGTFHGLCHRILRAHAAEAGLPKTFQIMDSGDQLSMIKRIMKQLNVDPDRLAPRNVQTYINWHKEHGVRADRSRDDVDGVGVMIYQAYESACNKEGLLDFGELLLRCYELLDRNVVIRNHYQDRFRHILVDEFQDTNILQYLWIKMLSGIDRTDRAPNAVFAVGDDDQSIYAFRGANVGNMSDFLRDFGITQPIRLEQNYRSTSNILNAANALIACNPERLGKNLWTDSGSGEKIAVVRHFDDRDEANYIAKSVTSGSGSYSDHAVLYRTNAQSRAIESALQNKGIPYRIYGGLRFFERAEVKHVLAYLRLIDNPDDDTSFLRVVNFPTRGIGAKSVETLSEEAARLGLSLSGAMASAEARYPSRMLAFAELMDAMRSEARGLSLCEIVKLVIKRSGLADYYGKEKDGEDKLANMNEIIAAAEGFLINEGVELSHDAFEPYDENGTTPLLGFLTQATLEAGDKNEADADAVQLMTVHAAKGLEFPYVTIAGVEEGVFPHFSAMQDESGLPEERRLMYVAITRAKKKLTISNCRSRMLHGETRYNQPSMFIDEIPPELVNKKDFTESDGWGTGSSQRGRDKWSGSGWNAPSFGGSDGYERSRRGRSGGWNSGSEGFERATPAVSAAVARKDRSFASAVSRRRVNDEFGYAVGDRVKHKRLGVGTVTEITGQGEDARIIIEFDQNGRRELLLQIAVHNMNRI